MKTYLPALLVGASVALVQAQPVRAIEASEIRDRARAILVKIQGDDRGTGFIFERQGNTYYVLTNNHVIFDPIEYSYEIETPDSEVYPVLSQNTFAVRGLDLVVVTFESDKDYEVARLDRSASERMAGGEIAYVVGWSQPLPGTGEERLFWFSDGKVSAIVPQPKNGYALIYTNSLNPGTSGSPIFDERGRVVGIHGQKTRDPASGQFYTLGIPAHLFLAARNDLVNLDPDGRSALAKLIALGHAKQKQRAHEEAIAVYTQALNIDPENPELYYHRGVAYYEDINYDAALDDLTRAIEIDENYAAAYASRGLIYTFLAEVDGSARDKAIADFNEAIRLNPQLSLAYQNRGDFYHDIGEYDKAIADYSQIIALQPNNAYAYLRRGNARRALGNTNGAPADFHKAASLYLNQGLIYQYIAVLENIQNLE